MSLRQLTTGAILLVAFCTGLYFWGEWQKRKFDASLPKPPAVEQQQDTDVAGDVTEDVATGHWHNGDGKPAEPQQPADAVLDEGIHFADLRGPIISEPVTDAAIEEMLATPEYAEALRTVQNMARYAPKYAAWSEKYWRLLAEQKLLWREEDALLPPDPDEYAAFVKQAQSLPLEERQAIVEKIEALQRKFDAWHERWKAHLAEDPGSPQAEIWGEEQ